MKSSLTKLCLKRPNGEIEFSLDKEDLISNLVSLGISLNVDGAVEILESEEKELLNTIVDEGWAIHYNVYTNRYYFYRLFPTEILSRIAELQERSIYTALENNLRNMTSRQFEFFIKTLLTNIPKFSNVRVTKQSRDGGIDFSAKMNQQGNTEILVFGQAKHWKSPVGSPEVRNLIGVLASNAKSKGSVRGMMIGLSGFTEPAKEAAWNSPYPIDFLSLLNLLSLMKEYNIGIQHFSIDYLIPDSKLWEELYE
jgi:hypothetical protein